MSFKSFIKKIKNIFLCDKQKDDLCFDLNTTEHCPSYDYNSPDNVVVQYSDIKKTVTTKKKTTKKPKLAVKKTSVKKAVVKKGTGKTVTKIKTTKKV
jgi:hypothetical protein